MEGKLNPIQQLDIILKLFNGRVSDLSEIAVILSGEAKFYNIEDIKEYLEKMQIKGITSVSLPNILKKLKKDDFIQDEANNSYSITWEGRLFILDGGYIGQYDNRYAEKIRVDKIELSQKNFRYTQNVLLILVSVGTLVAAWYYLNEMNAHYYHWW
ncbi:MAG TPA: hypothetical protein VNX01_03825 [Bacteroidia bacterium]|jgi:hypothetical protein|nr:hypothetical protein [Bacteroidia bacterium]